jgi:hypothetical protein
MSGYLRASARSELAQGGPPVFISPVDAELCVRNARRSFQRILPQWATDALRLRQSTGGVPRWERAPVPSTDNPSPSPQPVAFHAPRSEANAKRRAA